MGFCIETFRVFIMAIDGLLVNTVALIGFTALHVRSILFACAILLERLNNRGNNLQCNPVVCVLSKNGVSVRNLREEY